MDLRRLTENLTVSEQIELEDVQALAASGVKVIIDNRPDAEIPPELGNARMAQAAATAGLEFHYLPIIPGQFDQASLEEFARVIDEADGPVHAYCRSGTRSTTAWALANAGTIPADEILSSAAAAGYDLSHIAAHLRR